VDVLLIHASSAMKHSNLLAAGAKAHQSKTDEALVRAGDTGDGSFYNVGLCGVRLLRDLCPRLPPARCLSPLVGPKGTTVLVVIGLAVGYAMQKMERRSRVIKGTRIEHQRVWRSPIALWLCVDAEGKERRTTKTRPCLK